MTYRLLPTLAALASLLLLAPAARANWPAWRGGPDGGGRYTGPKPPTEWSPTKNVHWRVDLPGKGNSSPVVWGQRVFVSQAVEKTGERLLLCFDRADGRLLWQKGTSYDPAEKTHVTNPPCSGSPVTDGERVIVSFGSAGVFCYDFAGNELWKRDLGKLDHIWGNGPSPVLHGDSCFVYHGPGTKTALHALDRKTGRTLWQFDEPKWDTSQRNDGFRGKKDTVTGTWSTPIVIRGGGRDELVMSFPTEVRAFEPATGRELWRCGGVNPLVYTSAIESAGIVVVMGGFEGNTVAVKSGGSGDVTATQKIWHLERDKGFIGSGVIKDGHIYFFTTKNHVACLELATGKTVWTALPEETGIKGVSWSSMTLAGDLIYQPNQAGQVLVFRAAPVFERIAVNSLAETSNSSLAISEGEIFHRTHKALWCFREGASQARR